jgi:hypothetical protein
MINWVYKNDGVFNFKVFNKDFLLYIYITNITTGYLFMYTHFSREYMYMLKINSAT